jgi:hypothetical protein
MVVAVPAPVRNHGALFFRYRVSVSKRSPWRSVFFSMGAIFGDLEGELQFAAEFFAVGEVELVFLDEELAGEGGNVRRMNVE